ncbi:Lsr2 family protein [Arthrobacter sp. UYEF20]|uniref:histone-like nucleoid-structuring protein Lsr2 n=1 Tax=Arthrobacter sp. UYEF20 TaxID=1756363 RepID=UPI003395E94D
MATKATVILIDDLDGGAADETVTFALDGAGHEIDLSAANAAALRSLLAPYISAGRKAKGTAGTAARRPGGAAARSLDAGRIRRWAIGNGYQMASRGPIPDRIVEDFRASNT